MRQCPSPAAGYTGKVTYEAYAVEGSAHSTTGAALNAGFNIKIEGESIEHEGCVAVSQSIEAGENAEIGTVITVTFEVQGNALPD